MDVVVPEHGMVRERHAGLVRGDLVEFDCPPVREIPERMDALLRHVADDEIANGHIVDVLVVRTKRALSPVRGFPSGSVEHGAVFTDERVATLGCDCGGDRMHTSFQTEGRPTRTRVNDTLDVRAYWHVNGAGWTRDRALRTNTAGPRDFRRRVRSSFGGGSLTD